MLNDAVQMPFMRCVVMHYYMAIIAWVCVALLYCDMVKYAETNSAFLLGRASSNCVDVALWCGDDTL